MFNEDKYNDDVNNAFKKLSEAHTPEEIKEILDNWPDQNSDNYNTGTVIDLWPEYLNKAAEEQLEALREAGEKNEIENIQE